MREADARRAPRHDGKLHAGEAEGSPATDACIALRGVTLTVGGLRLVDSVDLSLDARQLTIVMGPNGAGKSLLLRLMHGLIAPSAGTISWRGQAATEETRRRQAMVMQRPVLLRRSVAANIDFVLASRDRADADLRDRLLDRVSLLAKSKQPARLLSGGEQQRLCVARALATEPDALFLDEPTSSLDPASAAIIESIVLDTQHAGTKVVLVTHDTGQARRLAGDIVFLHHGQLIEHTRADAFFAGPQSPQARQFLAGKLVL